MTSIKSWHIPLLAFYSRSLYILVARTWRGTGLGYLFLITAFCSLLTTYHVARLMDDIVNQQVYPVVQQLPTLTFSNGTLQPNSSEPIVIKGAEGGNAVLVVDTSDNPKFEQIQAPIWLLKHQARIEQPNGQFQVIDFAPIEQLSLDQGGMQALVDRTVSVMKPLSYIPIQLGEFGYRALQVLLYAIGGIAYAALFKVRLGYKTILRLTCVAVTPSLLISTILTALGFYFPVLGIMFFVMSQAYLYFAIQSVAAGEPDGDGYLEV